MNEKVTINENGQRRRITKQEAAVKQLANKAASGDKRAIQRAGVPAGIPRIGPELSLEMLPQRNSIVIPCCTSSSSRSSTARHTSSAVPIPPHGPSV
jgi:hypothetical protein